MSFSTFDIKIQGRKSLLAVDQFVSYGNIFTFCQCMIALYKDNENVNPAPEFPSTRLGLVIDLCSFAVARSVPVFLWCKQ